MVTQKLLDQKDLLAHRRKTLARKLGTASQKRHTASFPHSMESYHHQQVSGRPKVAQSGILSDRTGSESYVHQVILAWPVVGAPGLGEVVCHRAPGVTRFHSSGLVAR